MDGSVIHTLPELLRAICAMQPLKGSTPERARVFCCTVRSSAIHPDRLKRIVEREESLESLLQELSV